MQSSLPVQDNICDNPIFKDICKPIDRGCINIILHNINRAFRLMNDFPSRAYPCSLS